MSEAIPSRRGLLGAIALAPALAVPGIVAAKAMPTEPATQALIDSYNAFLHFERRQLLWELANAHGPQWKRLMAWVPMDNAGGSFHYEPPTTAGERASLVLRAVGCDWRDES